MKMIQEKKLKKGMESKQIVIYHMGEAKPVVGKCKVRQIGQQLPTDTEPD